MKASCLSNLLARFFPLGPSPTFHRRKPWPRSWGGWRHTSGKGRRRGHTARSRCRLAAWGTSTPCLGVWDGEPIRKPGHRKSRLEMCFDASIRHSQFEEYFNRISLTSAYRI